MLLWESPGAVAGAVGLSVLTALLSAVIEPESFGEGQFVMGFAFTVPVGMMLGGVTSLVVRQSRQRQRTCAGWVAIVGGAAILAFDQEYLGPAQLVLFFIVGLVLGRFNNHYPWLLGFMAVSVLPIVAAAEVWVDATSHTLLPGSSVRQWHARVCRPPS